MESLEQSLAGLQMQFAGWRCPMITLRISGWINKNKGFALRGVPFMMLEMEHRTELVFSGQGFAMTKSFNLKNKMEANGVAFSLNINHLL